jgi:hypothetical protein
MGNCNNCRENRVKNIRINGNKIILCHPDFNKIKDKITVGLHIDLKINVQWNKTNISVFPIEPTFFDKTFCHFLLIGIFLGFCNGFHVPEFQESGIFFSLLHLTCHFT